MIPIALTVLNLRLIIQLTGYVRLAINPKLEPMGVPLILDVAEQADEEASKIDLIR
jgi:hypothetical protein